MRYTIWHFYLALFAELLTIPIAANAVFLIYLLFTGDKYPDRTHHIAYLTMLLLPTVQYITRSLT